MPIPEATSTARLVWPSHEYLAGYVAALERGWSPNNLRPEATQEELLLIRADADGFLKSLVDREAKGPPVALPDGSTVPRLPGYRRWLWDGEFCGSIGLRWQHGTNALPGYCLGHIGYGVVPWKSGRGYAKEALRSLLPEAASVGLGYVEITTSPDNVASQHVIRANGGVLVEEFIKTAELGGTPELRFRIALGHLA
ncbi:putative acetyltransferase [Variovorax boronicumulans]|uniref:GNAT family N-acetyltransferase n=1 Tax=Variovorax boronicumulans TaxID=436515 RepID=UPI002784FE86|nr:GNAT family N-acetyltransferase [Variovorax boronicumulans]MDQ0033337.1 putative acetyltransferase [Variovorax boronicumulans]MDQ0042638.1 putative acetyltransferase [Variovorax boronicumulans]